MPHQSHTFYVGQSLVWAMILVGIGVNGWVNYHQENMNRSSIEDRNGIKEQLRVIEVKVRHIRAHQVREAQRRGEPVILDEELFPPTKKD